MRAEAPAESLAENRFEKVHDIVVAALFKTAKSLTLKPLLAVAIIQGSLLFVAEHLVGFVDQFELLLRFLVVGVAVGVVLEC